MKNPAVSGSLLALLTAIAAVAATVGGCASGGGLVAPGTSDVAPSAESRPVGAQPASSTQWPHLRALDPQNLESRGFTRMEATPVASKGHHPPGWKGIVHVDNDGAALYRALRPGVVLPEGTVLAEAHVVESGAPGPIFAMAKTNGAWTYSVVAPDGRIEEQGDIPTCARCHGESPHDAVFGPRTPPKERAPDAEKDEGLSPSDTEGPAGKSKRPGGGKKRRLVCGDAERAEPRSLPTTHKRSRRARRLTGWWDALPAASEWRGEESEAA